MSETTAIDIKIPKAVISHVAISSRKPFDRVKEAAYWKWGKAVAK